MKRRTQYWDNGGFSESFEYDALSRLRTSQVDNQPVQTFGYDAIGNIMSKTDVGTYTYPVSGTGTVLPHGVKTVSSIPGSFEYDANGNVLSGAGKSATWTSFDMPLTITKGAVNASFVYGPEHQRVRQDRSDGSSVVYAGAQEVEIKGGITTVKTYWPSSIGVEIDRGSNSTEMSWMHVDRLGSVIALTDESGAIREKLEYDVWGKRRSTSDNSSTPDSLDGRTDNRGFTGHEMLDQFDLVHMNGRVYNPQLGKFLSGDPFVADPTNGQNYNRYSYVSNNPTNLTDPTGFLQKAEKGVVVTGSLISKRGEKLLAALIEVGGLTHEQADQIRKAQVRNSSGAVGLMNASSRSTLANASDSEKSAIKQGAAVVASGQQDDWNEGSDERRQKQLAALPRRDIGVVIGEPGQDEIQVVKIAAPKMRGDAVQTDFENCGAICRGDLGKGLVFGINIQSNNSHLACVVLANCPAGLTPTGRNVHTHGPGGRFKISRIDNIFSNNQLDEGKSLNSQTTDAFSETDLKGAPGYLVTDKDILFHKGQETENLGEYKK